MFSCKSFIVSGLTFRYLIYFESIFVYGVRKCPSFILLQVINQFSQHHLLKRLSFLQCILLPPLSWIRCPCCCCCSVASVMSDSVPPHRWQPTRLPHPWDSPGKNTGVGCHFLLQCMKVRSESKVAQSCPTIRDPVDCSLPGSSVRGILQARVLLSHKSSPWSSASFFINIDQSLDLIPFSSPLSLNTRHNTLQKR